MEGRRWRSWGKRRGWRRLQGAAEETTENERWLTHRAPSGKPDGVFGCQHSCRSFGEACGRWCRAGWAEGAVTRHQPHRPWRGSRAMADGASRAGVVSRRWSPGAP